MASSVFYKFKSSRDESKVTFDGTGISVFDLKKEIILANNLGKANDFDLAIFDSSSNEGMSCRVSVLQAFSTDPGQNTRMTRISSPAPPLSPSSDCL